MELSDIWGWSMGDGLASYGVYILFLALFSFVLDKCRNVRNVAGREVVRDPFLCAIETCRSRMAGFAIMVRRRGGFLLAKVIDISSSRHVCPGNIIKISLGRRASHSQGASSCLA